MTRHSEDWSWTRYSLGLTSISCITRLIITTNNASECLYDVLLVPTHFTDRLGV